MAPRSSIPCPRPRGHEYPPVYIHHRWPFRLNDALNPPAAALRVDITSIQHSLSGPKADLSGAEAGEVHD